MGENPQENQINHFSKKVLFLSLLVMAINVAFYGLMLFQQKTGLFKEVAPRLVFNEKFGVKIKTPFDTEYLSARTDQNVLTGSYIKTDEKSYAEIQLEGDIVRLDENTEIQLLNNNFQNNTLPRFVYKLYSGDVWVNAYDPIIISTDQSQARFSHSIGSYMYSKPLNRLLSVTGNIDLSLLNEEGGLLTQFVVPLKNQVTFVNSQLVPDYAKLEYSKLKKELKMGSLPHSILDDEWVKANTSDDMNLVAYRSGYIYSAAEYEFKSVYYALRAKLALIPGRESLELLNLATLELKYLLGGINLANDNNQAKTLLDSFNSLSGQFKDDPLFNDFVQSEFYAIRNVRTDTPAYLVKEDLRQYLLLQYNSPELLRTYLADMDFLLRVGEIGQSEKVAEEWLKQWKPEFKKNFTQEFDRQARIYDSIILAYINKITPKFLSILDEIGDYRLANSTNPEETLYEIALERLDVCKYLVSVYRYIDASTYLRTSYSKLNLFGQKTSAAARDIFIKEATLIADRINFAEQSLKGAAEAVDETKFKDYLTVQERDKSLTERLNTFLAESKPPAEQPVVYPTVNDVIQKFAQNRITVFSEDIVPDPKNPFEFDIKNGRFMDRADDGSAISFSARFNYSTSGLYNIILNGKIINGSFTIEDFVRVAKAGESEIKVENVPEINISKLADYLNLQENEEAQRSQIVAQDLAENLMIRELEKYNILVPSTQQVLVLDTVTLTKFKVSNVFIQDPSSTRKIEVNFDYNSVTKMLTNISLVGEIQVSLPAQISAEDFVKTIVSILNTKENEIKEGEDAVSELSSFGLVLSKSNLSFASPDFKLVKFKEIQFKNMPIKFDGIYNRAARILTSAQNLLLTSENISVTDYMKQLSELWVIDYLAKQGISINKSNITTSLPSDKVNIIDYTRGTRVLNFTFDVTANRLTNITLEGGTAKAVSMTFDEFSLIEGGTPQTPTLPKIQFNTLIGTCGDFPDRLEDCIKYSCEFPDPISGKTLGRRITGLIDSKCRYTEELANGQYMQCDYTADYLTAVAQQNRDYLALGEVITGTLFGTKEDLFTYTVGGKTTTNPAKEALANGECVIGSQ